MLACVAMQYSCMYGYNYIIIVLHVCYYNLLLMPNVYPLVTSFCEMTKYLLKLPGVKSVLSNRLCCQDLLEQFFGKQRQRGGTNDNPNINQFLNNTSAIRVADSVVVAPSRGNCCRSQGKKRKHISPGDISVTNENEPLPKRTRCSKKNM